VKKLKKKNKKVRKSEITLWNDDQIIKKLGMNNFLKAVEYYEDSKIFDLTEEGKVLKAKCKGRSSENYVIEVKFDGDDFVSTCSCPVGVDKGGLCKHVTALLLTFQEYITGDRKIRGKRSEDVDKKIKAKINEYRSYTLPDIKKLLKTNDLSTTGIKSVLLERLADALLFGPLPRCEKCGGGRIRIKEGIGYYCPGYMDDDQWTECDFFATEIKRSEWINSEIN